MPIFQGPKEHPGPAYKATQAKFTEKLLNNPHIILRQTPSQDMGGIDARGVQHAAGEQWWGSTVIKDPRLQAQKPLLDGGEGKSLNKTIVGNIADTTKGVPKDRGEFAGLAPPMLNIADTNNCKPKERDELAGLMPPTLDATGEYVTGADKSKYRVKNKRRRKETLATQQPHTQWTKYKGEFEIPSPMPPVDSYRGQMCPSNMALHHPAASLLKEWATYGCPTRTGWPWTKEEMQEAVDRGPHQSALSDEAIAHFCAEVDDKIKSGQARLVAWESIKDDPPSELKISPIAAIPHKSKQFWSILDLSFHPQLKQGGILPSFNANTIKTAPTGAIDQLGNTLTHIIHAFAETEEDARIFMAKWDIKDGFWRMDAEEGAEWNFSYVLPQQPGKQVYIVVPASLQMGWV